MSQKWHTRKRTSYKPIVLTSKSIHPILRQTFFPSKGDRHVHELRRQRSQAGGQDRRLSSRDAFSQMAVWKQERQPIKDITELSQIQRSGQFNVTEQDEHNHSEYHISETKVNTGQTGQTEDSDFVDKFKQREDHREKLLIVKPVKICPLQNVTVMNSFHFLQKSYVFELKHHDYSGIWTNNLLTKDQPDGKQRSKQDELKDGDCQKKEGKAMSEVIRESISWKEYFDKYYINPTRLKPLFRRKQDSVQQQVLAIKATTPNSKSYGKRYTVYSRKASMSVSSCRTTQMTIANETYSKIEGDIELRRRRSNRKDHFVFGLSQTSKYSDSSRFRNIDQIKAKFENYKDFLWKINFTNGLYAKSREEGEKTFKVFVGYGNNSPLIKGIMRRRYWWQLVDKISEDTNFVWTQLKSKEYYVLQISRGEPSQSKNQTLSMQGTNAITDSSNPQTEAIMSGFDLQLWRIHYLKHKKLQDKQLSGCYKERLRDMLMRKNMKIIENSSRLKVHNHFQCNYFLGNKKALFYSLRKYYMLNHKDPFVNLPLTFHISKGINDKQFLRFLAVYQQFSQQKLLEKSFRNIWIVKPGEFTNRGKGISVCTSLDEIKARLRGNEKNKDHSTRSFIVQKYIQKPLLYNRRKFDIRHYMLMTCINGQIKGYWYDQGYIRTTSSEYNVKNCKDIFTHLTNDAVQQHGENYGKFEKGNKLSYLQFQKYLDKTHPGVSLGTSLHKMRELTTDCMKATYGLLSPERREHNFELFGLDFMLDEHMNVYLLQVNTNPCLETSCPLLNRIITSLMENVFKICIDPLFSPPNEWSLQRKYQLGDNALEENRFTLIFDEQEEERSVMRELYRGIALENQMGRIDEEEEEYDEEAGQWNEELTDESKKHESHKI